MPHYKGCEKVQSKGSRHHSAGGRSAITSVGINGRPDHSWEIRRRRNIELRSTNQQIRSRCVFAQTHMNMNETITMEWWRFVAVIVQVILITSMINEAVRIRRRTWRNGRLPWRRQLANLFALENPNQQGCQCCACQNEELPVFKHEEPHCFCTAADEWPARTCIDGKTQYWAIVHASRLSAPPVFNTIKDWQGHEGDLTMRPMGISNGIADPINR